MKKPRRTATSTPAPIGMASTRGDATIRVRISIGYFTHYGRYCSSSQAAICVLPAAGFIVVAPTSMLSRASFSS